MAPTQLGGVDAATSTSTTTRPRRRRPWTATGTTTDSGPHKVLDYILSLPPRGRAKLLAERLGVSEATINSRRTGRTAMTIQDVQATAEFLDVPPELFLGDHRDAVQWIMTNRRDDYPCNSPLAS